MFNKSTRKNIILGLSIGIFSVASYASENSHSHSHGHASEMPAMDHSQHNMSDESSGMFLKKKQIDGYTVSFHIMEANDSMRHGGSHNFMIKIEKDGKVQKNVLINSKVIHPNGKSESKKLMKMGDWFMNGYDLAHKGKHQMMILFKTPDGKKHKGGVYYSE